MCSSKRVTHTYHRTQNWRAPLVRWNGAPAHPLPCTSASDEFQGGYRRAERSPASCGWRKTNKETWLKKTVLLVEDEPVVREIISAILRDQGYTVMEAASAEKAAQVWKDQQHNIGLLLTDIQLATDTSGLELAEQLREIDPFLHVVFVSGQCPAFLKRSDLVDGLNFLPKPFTAAGLLRIVEAQMEQANS